MNFHFSRIAAALTAVLASSVNAAEPLKLGDLQVTATREPEPVEQVPASISLVTGEELRARGANDLRTALALVAGVEGTSAGDAGPAGAVPALWGLREADAFLLVVDGVPWGGAFNPATPSVDLNGVERIEILRGSAPVMYGATSFVGVIHVIHYAAGAAPTSVTVTGGSNGTYGVSGNASLAALGSYKHSVGATIEQRGYSVDREEFKRYNGFYRGGAALGAANFHFDADVSVLKQTPGNVIFRNGAKLRTDLIPEDANHNPADAKLDQSRFHLATGFDGALPLGNWAATLAFTRTNDDNLRGFLRDYAPVTGNVANNCDADGNPGADAPDGKCDDFDADGFAQKRHVTDVYFDAHVTSEPAASVNVTWGVDYLYGRGRQNAVNFGYFVSLDGHDAPPGSIQHPDEIVSAQDTRHFYGVYSQADWKIAPRVDLVGGLRLNHTREATAGQEIVNDMDQMEVNPGIVPEQRSKTRLAGVIGASWEAFKSGNDALALYADYRNTYKPLARDFGPEAETAILEPETANSYEIGVKGRAFDARYEYDASVFRMDFKNLLTFDDSGSAINGGRSRFTGFEYEGRWTLAGDLKAAATYAYHDSRFKQFRRDDGAAVDGKRLELAPYHLAGLGLLYVPARGFSATAVANYVGGRALNKSNSLIVGGYTTIDASAGYRFGQFGVHLNGYNLTDRRDPIAESELASVAAGASSYYLLPARRVTLSVSMELE